MNNLTGELKNQYVVAVSGGVDSMVLLDMLINPDRRLKNGDWGFLPSPDFDPRSSLIVAHINHGIRLDSSSDEELVRGVVGEYGLRFESAHLDLGEGVSEEAARIARYNFLRQCCNKYNAQLLTAHHQDDLLETVIINLIRGTGWRGLVSLGSNQQIFRPFLTIPKSEILVYAKNYNIKWREDSTNQNTEYLRNYIRHELLRRMVSQNKHIRKKLLDIHDSTEELKNKIATELQKRLNTYQISDIKYVVPRYDLIMYPPSVSYELIYCILTRLDPTWHPSSLHIKKSLHFIKTAFAHKTYEVSGGLILQATTQTVQFKKR